MHHLRVLIYDHYEVFRVGLRFVMQSVSDISVVGYAGTPGQLIAMSHRLAPDLVLISSERPAEALAMIRILTLSGVRVIAVSHSELGHDVVESLDAGACGYLTEGVLAAHLVEAVRGAAHGLITLDTATAVYLRSRLRDAASAVSLPSGVGS